jgi:pilus assembly protein CpaC
MRVTLKNLAVLSLIVLMTASYAQMTNAQEQSIPMIAATEPAAEPMAPPVAEPAVVAESPLLKDSLPPSEATPTPSGEVVVELNKGRMIKLDQLIASVAISDPTIADVQVVSQKMLFVRGKKVGETTLYAVDGADNMVFSAVLQVTHNLSKLQAAVKRASPDSDIVFHSVDGGLVIEGFSPSVEEATKVSDIASGYVIAPEKIINLVKTGGSDQVTLQVRIVEMARSDIKRLGVNLQNVTVNGAFGLQVLQGNDIEHFPANVDTTPDTFLTPSSVLDRGSSTDTNIFLHYKDLNSVVSALETQGLATVLAEPSLTTISGKAASFLAGGQFPLPVVQSSSGSAPTVTIQYQPFGVSLNFTPVVMNKNRISLTVAPEVSTLDFSNPIQVSGVTYPIINTRKASAVVELGSGQSFMLAGLLKNEGSNAVSKFPGVGDLPVLGALFRSTQFQNNQTELVILVTPYIVRPVSDRSKLQTPIQGYVPPNDLQRLLLGNLYQQEPMQEETPQTVPALHGGGFLLGE